jgi:hypothetical protein
MPDLELGNENEEESLLVQAIYGSELPMKMLAPSSRMKRSDEQER